MGKFRLDDISYYFTNEMLEKVEEETFDRDTALRYLLDGKKVSNTGWIKDIYVEYQPDSMYPFVIVNITDGTTCFENHALVDKINWYLYEEPKAKEMTLEDISKALGFDVKIVKG